MSIFNTEMKLRWTRNSKTDTEMSQLMRLWYLSHRRQRRLRRSCASAQSRQSLRCLHTWRMEVDEGSDQSQTSSPTGWLGMRVWRMHLRRTEITIFSWHGSNSGSMKSTSWSLLVGLQKNVKRQPTLLLFKSEHFLSETRPTDVQFKREAKL